MSSPEITLELFGKTDVGLIREHNEDNFLVADVAQSLRTSDLKEPLKIALTERGALFLVCDGMGGAAAGEVASQMAVDSIYGDLCAATEALPRERFARLLRKAIERANDRIFTQSRDNQSERGMGTTCTAAALVDSTLVIGQIGDSRCYVWRNDKLAQVTKDQSLAGQLIEAGAMTAEEAKAFEHANIILQALGVQERVEVVLSQVDLRKGDVVLVCSDGLHGPVSDEEITDVLRTEPDLVKAGLALIQKALDHDGPDNVTMVLARFDGAALAAPTAADEVKFVGYDPGRDPGDEPPPPAPPPPATAGTDGGAARSETPILGAPMLDGQSGYGDLRPRAGLRTFVLLALFAAAAGALFLHCQREETERSMPILQQL